MINATPYSSYFNSLSDSGFGMDMPLAVRGKFHLIKSQPMFMIERSLIY